MAVKIPKRVSTALINSLGAGVVPRIGLEHIAVGREKEIAALFQDLENVAEGGAAFRFMVGRYGSGKSFMLQLIRNHAMERGFVVADADLSPERRLVGSNGQGVATYRELLQNISTKIRPDGGALISIIEGWINSIQNQVAQDTGMRPKDDGFDDQVEAKILAAIKETEGLVHGFAFANVITTYWRGYRLDDDAKKNAALRWLRADFANKIEAKSALGVRDIIDDDSWYDYIKLMAKFVSGIGYKGLLVLLDEAVHLYKINHTLSRQDNYDKLLAMFNDTMQGKAEHLGIYLGGTPRFLEDPKRGLFNDQAWQRRTAKSRFTKGFQDTSGPVVQLETLTKEEILILLQRLADVHATHYGTQKQLTKQELQAFVQEIINRLGAEALLTPGEIVRDFISVLNILQQNPDISWHELIQGSGLPLTATGKDLNVDENGEVAEFTL
ncbi:ATP-binding protein [Chroococcidiopsis sp. CCMEE 29]|uniref:ATP-binding protein n=1 Tax=Chroococcidiopsis sp. CCMEE 29 TaxID=155894 RepID=UPI002021AF0F|nr:ATP-binding protein [Chroococcidiopsis sp. CCMEE 29]